MKNKDGLIIGLIVAGMITFFVWLVWFLGFRSRVEQEYKSDTYYILYESGSGVRTLVWFRGDIVKSFYDDLPTISDSLLDARVIEGKKIISILEKTDY